MANKTSQSSLKNSNSILEIIKNVTNKQVQKINIPKYYYGRVININTDNSKADIEIVLGVNHPILRDIYNKSGVILSINDIVLVTAPNGDLSDCYVDKNSNPIPSINAQNIIGELTVGGETNRQGAIFLVDMQGAIAMELSNQIIDFYDWQKNGFRVGSIATMRDVDDNGDPNGQPSIDIVAEPKCSVMLGMRNDDLSGSSSGAFVVNNKAYNDIQDITAHYHLNAFGGLNVSGITKIDVDSHHAIYVQSDADGSNEIYGNTNAKGYDWSGFGTISGNNLQISGNKNCVMETEHYGSRLFYSHEYAESYLSDIMRGTITNGTMTIYVNSITRECINTDIEYDVRFFPEENCNWQIVDKQSDHFVITADKDVKFSCELFGKRRGFENCRLQYADNLESKLDNVSIKHKKMISDMLDNSNSKNKKIINDLWRYANRLNNIKRDLFYKVEKRNNKSKH